MKQIIVMRTDLGMRKGKMIAQGAHASLALTLANLEDTRVKTWLNSAFTKIAVKATSEEELISILYKAKEAGLLIQKIVDNGATEFNGVKTLTCIAIGPDTNENLAPVTGSLKLL